MDNTHMCIKRSLDLGPGLISLAIGIDAKKGETQDLRKELADFEFGEAVFRRKLKYRLGCVE